MQVFVYGTLCDPEQARAILGRADYGPDATLAGLHRVEGRYPTLAPGGSVTGRLLRVDADGLAALDRYEGLDAGLYVRVAVPFEGGTVQGYVGDPDRLGVAEAVRWPGEGSLAARVEAYVAANDVRVRR
jgi:gamma-glutamylaminecyclotransferase